MPAVSMSGAWRITVVSKESDFAQRILISGDVQRMLRGEVGVSVSVSGRHWLLGFEFARCDGVWQPNASVEAGDIVRHGDELQRLIATKDVFWTGDSDHNDLKLLLTRPAPVAGPSPLPHHVDANLDGLSAPFELPSVEISEVSRDRLGSSVRTRSVGTPVNRNA